MKECPFCGEQIQDTAHKCRFCGEWLDKQCPECGHWSKVNVAICPACGFSFAEETKPSAEETKQETQESESAQDVQEMAVNQEQHELPVKPVVSDEPTVNDEPTVSEVADNNAPTAQTSSGISLSVKRKFNVFLAYVATIGSVVSVLCMVKVGMKGGDVSDKLDFLISVVVAVPFVANAIMLYLLKRKFAQPLSVAIDWVATVCVLTALCGFFDIGKWFLLVLLLGHFLTRGIASCYLLKNKQEDTAEDTAFLGRLWGVEAVVLLVISCMVFFGHREDYTMLLAMGVVLIGWPIGTMVEVGLAEKILSARDNYKVLRNLFWFLILLVVYTLRSLRHLF